MSLFRKPKKIQRRVFCADDDEDIADGEPEAPPPPMISNKKKENKPIKSTQLLSFADEEEEGEVFKVKKSKQSSRLSKRREKEKKKTTDGDSINNKNDEETPMETDEEPKSRKKLSLEGLILSGRAALAADGAGDVSDGSEEEAKEEEPEAGDGGFHRYRPESVRAALAAGTPIPDAALIHAARKTRQQARELGDFVPVSEPKPGPRLPRDDCDDDDDDDEDGRIEVRGLELPSDKPKRGTAAAPRDEELDSEPDEWELQQVNKAMPGAGELEMNPFAVAPPPPKLGPAEAHLRPLRTPDGQPLDSAKDLVQAMKERLEELKAERAGIEAKAAAAAARLSAARATAGARAARRGDLDQAYRRAQAVRGYLTDLVECLDEKMPQLEELEKRNLLLWRRRAEFLTERRRADVRDQAQDVLATAARTGALGTSVAPPTRGGPDAEARTRRAAEREGRRRARRLAREAAAAGAGATLTHQDGDSSDDELPPAEEQHYRDERESIRRASLAVFADALPAWRSARRVSARVSRWRRRAPALYCDAYLPHTLPRLLAPYVRHELLLWNPLADEGNEDYEKMDWYKCLSMYGVKSEQYSSDSSESSDEERPSFSEDAVGEDPDLMLVPTLINKVLIPKLTELVEASWDPLCVRASVRLRRAVLSVAQIPAARPALRRLAAAVRVRLAGAVSADVFLPTLPHQMLEGGSPGANFWRRCLGAGVRLLRAALALAPPPPLLRADALVMALVETLCTGAGAAPGPLAALAAYSLAAALPRGGELRARALARVAVLAQRALTGLHSDNPLHFQGLEQARNVIAESEALEANQAQT